METQFIYIYNFIDLFVWFGRELKKKILNIKKIKLYMNRIDTTLDSRHKKKMKKNSAPKNQH
jgi:hypothetical protein